MGLAVLVVVRVEGGAGADLDRLAMQGCQGIVGLHSAGGDLESQLLAGLQAPEQSLALSIDGDATALATALAPLVNSAEPHFVLVSAVSSAGVAAFVDAIFRVRPPLPPPAEVLQGGVHPPQVALTIVASLWPWAQVRTAFQLLEVRRNAATEAGLPCARPRQSVGHDFDALAVQLEIAGRRDSLASLSPEHAVHGGLGVMAPNQVTRQLQQRVGLLPKFGS